MAVGRNRQALRNLDEFSPDSTIQLNEPEDSLKSAFAREARAAGFDVIIDYLWGSPTEALLVP